VKEIYNETRSREERKDHLIEELKATIKDLKMDLERDKLRK
jgi:hypothetical protein